MPPRQPSLLLRLPAPQPTNLLRPVVTDPAGTCEVDTYIVERIIIVLRVLRACASELQRKEYTLLLRALAPLLKGRGDKSGMVTVSYTHLTLPTTPYV